MSFFVAEHYVLMLVEYICFQVSVSNRHTPGQKGFIWVGTHGGLNRYGGYGFRLFQYTPFNFSTLGVMQFFS
jgi:hypothetical protein